jgi:hypothetical protein
MPSDTARVLELTPQQERLLLVPESLNVFNAGGRGSGKTRGGIYGALRHAELYGPDARIWILRKSFIGLQDVEAELRSVVPELFPGSSYNAQRHQWRLANGAAIELRCLESERDFPPIQGRACTLLLVDEAQQWLDPVVLDLARSCLRGPKGIPTRSIFCANPAGAGSDWIFRRYFAHGTPDWRPFKCPDTDTSWARAHSTVEDNIFVDRKAYLSNLRAATAGDSELQRAWIEGDFSVLRGSYFGSVVSDRCRIGDWEPGWREPETAAGRDPLAAPDCWDLYLSFDFGVRAPACCHVMAWSPGAKGPDDIYYSIGSRAVLDEWTTARIEEGRLNDGTAMTISRMAAEIKLMSARWRIEPTGVADPALWAATGSDSGTVADQFAAQGVYFSPAPRVSRVAGWSQVRELLGNAGDPGRPGLYINVARCPYLWTTLVHAPRDPRRPDDLDTSYSDHALDSVRYGCLYLTPHTHSQELLV